MFLFLVCLSFVSLLGLTNEAEHGRRGLRQISGRTCVLPEPPNNGNYTLYSQNSWIPPGGSVPHLQVITVSCNPGYHVQGHMGPTIVSLCNNGEWSQTFPECIKLCVPLVSSSVEVKCIFTDKEVSCNNFMVPGTIASVACRKFFKLTYKPDYTNLLCQDNGQWSHPLFQCAPPDCGVPTPAEALDSSSPQGVFPWMATIYRQNKTGQWEQSCLGTLITSQIVLTGARCLFSKNGKLRPQDIKVGLGKYDRDYYKYQDYSTIIDVAELVTPAQYAGGFSFDKDDIGLIDLSTSIDVSSHIMPACMDWNSTATITSGTVGHVSGWNESQSKVILSGEMKCLDVNACKLSRRVPLLLITYDKFCADSVNGISVVGKGDRGGAITVEKNGKHFVVGILSSQVLNRQSNDAGSIALFTDTEHPIHKGWLNVQTTLLERKHHDMQQQSCQDSTNASVCSAMTSTTTLSPRVDTTTHSIAGPVCIIPDPPDNRLFSRYHCPDQSSSCSKVAGDSVADSEFIVVTCSPGFYLVQGVTTFTSRALTTCQKGVWDPTIPHCYKLCHSLTSLTVEFRCWQGPNLVSCDKPMLPETIVEYNCKEFHESSNSNEANRMKCKSNGDWSRDIPRCTPKCGQSNINSEKIQTTIVGGNFSEPGNFPWHAAIYHRVKISNNWAAKCGGTLISARAVLTAAHCVTVRCSICKPPPLAIQDVMVSLGKNFREWNTTEETEIKRRIQEIRVPQDYVGSSLNFAHDIALLILESDVPVNTYVLPACVDYHLKYLKQLQEDKTLAGYVAGWGNTEECSSHGSICGTSSNTLKYTQTTIINFHECFNITQSLKASTLSRLTTDKYCAGNGSESVVQQGDSGGGLTFVFGGLHYIYGIVSVKLKSENGGKLYYSFGAFTSVSLHLDWLKSQLY